MKIRIPFSIVGLIPALVYFSFCGLVALGDPLGFSIYALGMPWTIFFLLFDDFIRSAFHAAETDFLVMDYILAYVPILLNTALIYVIGLFTQLIVQELFTWVKPKQR